MFRSPRATTPSPVESNLGPILEPFPVILWGPIALAYLGVPIVVGVRFYGPHSSKMLTNYQCADLAPHDRGF